MGWQNSDQLMGLTLHLLPKIQMRYVVIDTGPRLYVQNTLKDRETCFFTLKTWQKTTIGRSLNLGHGCWEQNDFTQLAVPMIILASPKTDSSGQKIVNVHLQLMNPKSSVLKAI
ncbi:uncharacterized protein [Palaemon carinicauda]|uniref:uncharacterized protein n=1 Tax=Palaemon carinicauda TaxID=392227 RepID=UPI0035B5BD1F